MRYGKMKHLDVEDMEKLEHSHTVGGNAKWCNHYGKQYGSSLKKLKIELPIWSTNSTSAVFPQKNWAQTYVYICYSSIMHNNPKGGGNPSVY